MNTSASGARLLSLDARKNAAATPPGHRNGNGGLGKEKPLTTMIY